MSKTRQIIANNFGRHHLYYNAHADVQKYIAGQLVELLPNLTTPRILEIGCGTGFLTASLFKKYPDGVFDITDLSPDMVAHCKAKHTPPQASYFVMDAENIDQTKSYDLIVSSMAFQWFQNPEGTLQKLSTMGDVYFSALGRDNFKEWKDHLAHNNLYDRTLNIHPWENVLHEEKIEQDYNDGLAFLRMLKNTGAATSQTSNLNRDHAKFKQALRRFDGTINWHIIYSRQPRQDTVIGA